MNRRVLIRRLVSILLLTVVVTGIAWVGLSAEVFGGFQRRATDALFPGAPTDKHGRRRRHRPRVDQPVPAIHCRGRAPAWPSSPIACRKRGAAVIVFDLVFSQASRGPRPTTRRLPMRSQRAGNVVFGEGVTKARAGKNGQPPFALEGTNV